MIDVSQFNFTCSVDGLKFGFHQRCDYGLVSKSGRSCLVKFDGLQSESNPPQRTAVEVEGPAALLIHNGELQYNGKPVAVGNCCTLKMVDPLI